MRASCARRWAPGSSKGERVAQRGRKPAGRRGKKGKTRHDDPHHRHHRHCHADRVSRHHAVVGPGAAADHHRGQRCCPAGLRFRADRDATARTATAADRARNVRGPAPLARRSSLIDLTATEAAARIASGDISSEELVRACLARIDALEPAVQAWAFLDRERALEQAKAADATRREGKGVGPLHGVPVGVKDIIDTADMPTENGCPVFKGRQPSERRHLRHGAAPGRRRRPRQDRHHRAGDAARRRARATRAISSTRPAAPPPARPPPSRPAWCRRRSARRPAAPSSGRRPSAASTASSRPSASSRAPACSRSRPRSTRSASWAGRSRTWRCWPMRCRAYDDRDPASLSTSRPRLLATATEDWPLRAALRLRQDARLEGRRRGHARGFRRACRAPGRRRSQEISLDNTTERGLAAARTVQKRRACLPLRPAARPRAGHDQREADGARSRKAAASRRRLRRRRSTRARRYYATVEEVFRELRHDPHARGARAGPEGPRHHRQPGVLRLLDLSRRAGRDAAAAGGRRPADGRAAHRRPRATTAACCAPRAGWRGTSPRQIDARFASGRRGRRLSPAACR